jgi:predicted nucleic acid-binding protein
MGQLNVRDFIAAQLELENFKDVWLEVLPGERLRQRAEKLVDRFPLKAADAMQLAAALEWCDGQAAGVPFISGDMRLLETARTIGFNGLHA